MALPPDELYAVSKKLLFSPDYIRFRSVCKSWRSAAPKRPQIPWLVVVVPTDTGSDEFQFYFYQFCFESNKFTRIIELPNSQLASTFKAGSTDYIGSSHGWWALFNRDTLSVSLYNPVTNSKIDLPSLQIENVRSDTFLYENRGLFSFTLTSDPHDSLSDCCALLYFIKGPSIFSKTKAPFYCKIGSSAWTEMEDIDLEYAHFCSYQGMTFIASGADVFVCDFGQYPRVCKIVSLKLEEVETKKYELRNSYLFEFDGDLSLLLVLYTFCGDENYEHRDGCNCGYIYFRIVKLYLIGCKFVKSEEIKSLGNKTLFLGEKNISCVTSSKIPGCKENSIYISLMDNLQISGNLNYLERYDFENGSTPSITDEFVGSEFDAAYVFWFAPTF